MTIPLKPKRLSLFPLLIIVCISVSAQTLEDMIYAMDNILQVEYNVEKIVEYKAKQYEENSFEKHHIYFSGEDTLHNAFFNFQQKNKTQIYNGKELILLDDNTNNATVVNLDSCRSWIGNRIPISGSILEVRSLLAQIYDNPKFEVTSSKNETRVICNGYNYKRNLVEEIGYFTEINIRALSDSKLPERVVIKTFLGQKENLSYKLVYSDFFISDYPTLNLFTQDFIDQKYDLVQHKPINKLKVGESIPNWSVYPLHSNNKILISELSSDSVILIEFWFTKCPPCIQSIPILTALNEKYKNRGFKILYINPLSVESDEEISQFQDQHDIKFDIYRFGSIVDELPLPTLILIDRKGSILYIHSGLSETLYEEISNLLNSTIS